MSWTRSVYLVLLYPCDFYDTYIYTFPSFLTPQSFSSLSKILRSSRIRVIGTGSLSNTVATGICAQAHPLMLQAFVHRMDGIASIVMIESRWWVHWKEEQLQVFEFIANAVVMPGLFLGTIEQLQGFNEDLHRSL